MAKNIILIIFLAIISYFIYRIFFYVTPLQKTTVKIKDREYLLEIAETLSQKSTGLMNRNSLCPNCGMIFVSSTATKQTFWMKNTLIPLDIIFLDSEGKVINIETATPQPSTSDFELMHYKSTAPSQYVIELNSGDSQKLNLKSGDQISLPKF